MRLRFNRRNYTSLVAGVSVLIISFGAISDDAEPTAEPYNHVLKRTSIENDGEVEVLVREILFAPGWQAPTHFHNADLFIYVIKGEFEVTMEHNGRNVYSAGQALEMRSETIMEARNPSDTDALMLAVFQVGAPDSPFVVPVD
jgi:quercetin dioxygenase-like cupin family protein